MADNETLETYEELASRWTEIRQSGEVLGHSRIERPAMLRRLPDVTGKDVLCLGCGSSDECQLMLDRGAARVVGVDASEKMLVIARQEAPGAEFIRADLDDLDLGTEQFDLIWASLALHYSSDFETLLGRMASLLREDGQVLFSLPHPVYYGAQRQREGKIRKVLTGFERDGAHLKIYGDCLSERLVSERLHGEFPVSFYVRSLGRTISVLLDAGFTILGVDEPQAEAPRPDDDAEALTFIERHQKIPLVAVFYAAKAS